jgi:hypothetical protein
MSSEQAESPQVSPHVADLLEKVGAKVAKAATIDQIRELAERAALAAGDNTLTITEIGELAELAINRAKKVDQLVTRLAQLVNEAGDGA